MNGPSRTTLGPDDPDDGGLDPNLTVMFDDADAPPHADAFVSATLAKLERSRRRSLLSRCAAALAVMLVGALLAPYVAQLTLVIASWITKQLPATTLAIASCACAALLAWRIARRQLG
jgi:hypothetical protein